MDQMIQYMKKKQDQMRIDFEERRKKFLARLKERQAERRHLPLDEIRRRKWLLNARRQTEGGRHKLDPDKSEKLAKIAAIYAELKMYDEVLEVGRQAYRANPKNQQVVENMARFKRPKYVIFGELPKTSTGKIQKFELRKKAKEI